MGAPWSNEGASMPSDSADDERWETPASETVPLEMIGNTAEIDPV